MGFKTTADGHCSHEIKRHVLLGRKTMTNLNSILKSRDIILLTKVRIVKGMVFAVFMYRCELGHKEGWMPRNSCISTAVLKKTLESPLDYKQIESVNPKGSQSWMFIERTDAETPVLWSQDAKSWLIGKNSDAGRDWGQAEKGTTKDEMAGWHNGLYGRESEWTPGDGDGQGGLVCCDSWGHKESDTTEWLNRTELNWTDDELLLINVPWSQEFSDVLRIWT